MHLTDDEGQLQDYLDGRLTLQEAQAVEAHLSNCSDCLAMFQQWQQLDFDLAHNLPKPALSPDFNARLREQVERTCPSKAEPTRVSERQQLEAELQERWMAQRKHFLRIHFLAFLDSLGYSTAAAV